jgi:hypothetical protein
MKSIAIKSDDLALIDTGKAVGMAMEWVGKIWSRAFH